jgi:hypothetical protein
MRVESKPFNRFNRFPRSLSLRMDVRIFHGENKDFSLCSK